MNQAKFFVLAAIVLCVGAVMLYKKLHGKKSAVETVDKPETLEKVFLREWTVALAENAHTYNGLFNGLLRVKNGNAKKPEKVLREWSQRTHYKFENQPVDTLCQEHIQSLIEEEDREGLIKWAKLLLDAAAAAGIQKEESSVLILSEANADAYVDWDGNDLYPDDEIEIITPAWYQNGKLLEQGQCKVMDAEEK